MLTSDQVLQGARRVTVRVVLSGRSFPARLVGTDSSYDLALLQIVGGRHSGRSRWETEYT